jgi:hypothetical protein
MQSEMFLQREHNVCHPVWEFYCISHAVCGVTRFVRSCDSLRIHEQ